MHASGDAQSANACCAPIVRIGATLSVGNQHLGEQRPRRYTTPSMLREPTEREVQS